MHLRHDDIVNGTAVVNGLLAVLMIHFWHQTQQLPYALASIWCSAGCIIYAIKILRR